MNLLVAAQRIRHRGAIACKGRRVKHDEIKTRNDSLVWLHGGLGFEPIEDVHGFGGTLVCKAVRGSVALGSSDRVRALIKHVNVRRARPRRVQTKSAEETEAVEHL